MDRVPDRAKRRVDIASLEVRKRYRVDWRHDWLRRSFRFTGTLLSIEETPSTPPEGEPERWLTFEVKPRFGRPTVQRVDVATLRAIEPA
jgi:hypothetical protein